MSSELRKRFFEKFPAYPKPEEGMCCHLDEAYDGCVVEDEPSAFPSEHCTYGDLGKNKCGFWKPHPQSEMLISYSSEDIWEWLESQLEAKGWISAEEPPNVNEHGFSDDYLVIDYLKEYGVGFYKNGKWYATNNNGEDLVPTHWQPLPPEPPEGK